MLVRVRGRQRYLHTTMDSFTRFWTAYTITPNKASDDVSCLLRASRHAAGKIPLLLVTDYDKAYHKAWLKEFRFDENGKQTYHHRHVHAHWDINNNKMERFNGTVRDFLRGMQEDYSPLLEGLRVYYNHVRPHGGISEGADEMTPGGGRHHGERAQVEDADPALHAVPEKVRIVQIRRGRPLPARGADARFFSNDGARSGIRRSSGAGSGRGRRRNTRSLKTDARGVGP